MALVDTDSYYNLLGVDKKASNAEIKRAYFVRARQFHPDKNPDDPQAEAKFKELSEAYQVLSDTQKRDLYDKYGKDGLSDTGVVDPALIFRLLFGGPNFDDLVGEMSMGLVLTLSMMEKPEGRTDEEQLVIVEKAVEEAMKQRVEKLVHKLLIRIEPLVQEVDVEEMVKADVELKLEAPGGGSLLAHIGYVYQSEANKKLKSFLGLGGLAASLREKGHRISQAWTLAKTAVHLSSTSSKLEALGEDASMQAERAQLEAALKQHGMSAVWRMGLLEIEDVTRQACAAILYDSTVTSDVRQKRASALLQLGQLYRKYSKKHVKHTNEILANFEASMDPNAAASQSSESDNPLHSKVSATSSSSAAEPEPTNTASSSSSLPINVNNSPSPTNSSQSATVYALPASRQ